MIATAHAEPNSSQTYLSYLFPFRLNGFSESIVTSFYRYLGDWFKTGGPLFVKVGQYLSTKRSMLPSEFTEHLKQLQDENQFSVPRLSELGFPFLNHLLLRCVGSGSMAAVFFVLNRDTHKKYAVKVKHPRLAEAVNTNHSQLLRIIDWINYFPDWSMFSGIRTIGFFFTPTLVDAMKDQQDFQKEQTVQNTVRCRLRTVKHLVHIPFVHFQNEHLMIQSYEDGVSLSELKLRYGPEIAIQACALLQTTYFNLMHSIGFVHSDLHEGNFRFRVDSRTKQLSLVLYDFGYCTLLDEKQKSYIRRLFPNCCTPSSDGLAWIIRDLNREKPEAMLDAITDRYMNEKLSGLTAMSRNGDSIYKYTDMEKAKEIYEGFDASSMVSDLVDMIQSNGLTFDPVLLSVVFNMAYIVDYDTTYYPRTFENMVSKYTYIAIYDAVFRIALDGEPVRSAFGIRKSTEYVQAADLGSTDLGPTDVGSADVGSADVGSADVGSADVGSADVEQTIVAASEGGSSIVAEAT